MKFTLYPIHWLASVWVDASFDLGKLPFEVLEDVHIESVSERFRPGEFHPFRDDLGGEVLTVLEDVRYGIVHRYDPDSSAQLHCGGVGDVVGHEDHKRRSKQLVSELAACLRLIRPMRQHALLMRGDVRAEDGSFDVIGFDIPTLHIQEVPEVQKLFMLRNQDADALRALAP